MKTEQEQQIDHAEALAAADKTLRAAQTAQEEARDRLESLEGRRVAEFIADGGTLEGHLAELATAREAFLLRGRQVKDAEEAHEAARIASLRANKQAEIDRVNAHLTEAEEVAGQMADAIHALAALADRFETARSQAVQAFMATGVDPKGQHVRRHCHLDGSWRMEVLMNEIASLTNIGPRAAFVTRVQRVHRQLMQPVGLIAAEEREAA